MRQIKKIKASMICACLICFFTVNNPSFAKTNNISDKRILILKQKELSKLNIKDKNNITKYYELKNKIIDLQQDLNQNKEAFKSTEEIIKTTQELYGENSIEAGSAYGRMLSICNSIPLFRDYKKYLDHLYKVIINNSDCDELKYLYYRYKIGFYNLIEQPYETIGLLNLLKKYTDPNIQDDKLYYLNTVIYSKLAVRNFKNVINDIHNYYYAISKDKNTDINNYVDYYNTLMGYYIESCQYNKIPNVYNKALKLLKGNDETAGELKFSLNTRYEKLFIELRQYDKALEIIKENETLISSLNNTNLTNQLYNQYKEYYEKQDDYKKLKEYIDKINRIEHTSLNIYNNYMNYYKNINNFKMALKYANKIKEAYIDKKDITPVLYANILRHIADINTDNIKERIQTALEAKTIYEKYLPSSSYKLFEINKVIIDLYNRTGEFDKAIESYQAAKKIILTLTEKTHKDYIELNEKVIEVYINKGDFKTAQSLLNEITEIAKQVYGKDNIYVYKLLLKKVNMYERFNKKPEADKLFEEITNAINNNQISGTHNDFYYFYYSKIARNKLQKNNIKEAEKYLKKAEPYAKKQWNIMELKILNSKIKQASHNK